MRRWLVVFVSSLWIGTLSWAAEEPMMKQGPGNKVEYREGPEQPSVMALVLWVEQLAQTSPSVWLQIPVRLELGGPLGTSLVASLGFEKTERVPLRLDDTAMGIPLSERIREYCPKLKGHCDLWLQGQWGALMTLGSESGRTFTVRSIAGARRGSESGLRAFIGRSKSEPTAAE
jgi:hypothetical protein